jgi:Cu/Ag efflux protein CusF
MSHSTLILRLFLLSISLIFIVSCNKQSGKGTTVSQMSGPGAATQTTTHHAIGTVTALDTKASTVEIDHGDIEGLMPAMQMDFSVKNAAVLNGIAVGDRIEFEVTNSVGGIQVTAIKKL